MPLPAGAKLGPYEVVGLLGAGGMGEVYRARDSRLGREVAVKVLPESFAAGADSLRRFEQEARAIGALNHPNVLAIYDVGTRGSAPYLVTELLEGATLREEMPVSQRKAIDYARQVAAGLAAAHSKGITHRDLKPENLFVARDGRVKILDFGLAKVDAGVDTLENTQTLATSPGVVMGTAGYMSPEQVRGKPADHRSDIFSCGVILYELLSGKRAFQGDSAVETMNAILKEDPPPLEDAALDRVVRRCIEKSPEQRFQSASDLAFNLEMLSGTNSGALSLSAPVAPEKRRADWMRYAAASLLLGLFAGAALGWWWQARHAASAPRRIGEQLTGTGIAYGPRISPDGHTLAFITIEGTQSQVAVMHPGSANWTVLTHQPERGEVEYVCWSRDATKIYFSRTSGIYSVPALGGDERLIAEHGNSPEALPDGSLLMVRANAGRRRQLHRFWPDTGRTEALDAEVLGYIRVFPDGREVVYVGRPLSSPQAPYGLRVFDLSSGQSRVLAPDAKLGTFNPAIGPEGNSVLAVLRAGDLFEVAEIARDGRSPPRTLATLSIPIWFIDASSDGSIYIDQVNRPFEVLRFPTSGGAPERLVGASQGSAALPLPDGRIVYSSSLANRATVMITRPGKNPAPLVETEDETSGPLALAGKDLIALKIGKPGGFKNRVAALVSIADGRVVRRVESTRGVGMSAMAASPDGKTIYYSSDGALWVVSVEGGEPRKIGLAGDLALHPNGKEAVTARNEADGVHFYRIPVNGVEGSGPEQQIPVHTDLRLNASLSPAAIRTDGKIGITVLRPDSWWDEPGILDPATGKVERLSVPYSGDAFAPAWTADGRMIAIGLPIEGSLWRFRKELK